MRGHLARKSFKQTLSSIRHCQVAVRAFLERKHRREAATVLQAAVRSWIARCRFRRDLTGIVRAQSAARGYLARRCYQRDRASVVICQSVVRRHQAMRRYSHTRHCVILLQTSIRDMLSRRKHTARVQHVVQCQATVLPIYLPTALLAHQESCHSVSGSGPWKNSQAEVSGT